MSQEAVLINPRRAKFIDQYLIHGNATKAAVEAGYGAAGAAVTATRLLKNANVAGVIQARQREDADQLGITRQQVLVALQKAYELAREQMNPAAMVQAAREIAKLLGFYAPQQVKVALDDGQAAEMRRMEAMTDQELLKIVTGRAS